MPTDNMPADFVSLLIPVPPMLEAAFGYNGLQPWVAFYWEPAGDELAWEDGQHGFVGANWQAYLEFTQHRAVWPTLAPFDFGSSEEAALHWLVLDRQERQLYAAPGRSVHAFLAQQTKQTRGLSWKAMLDLLLPPTPTPEEIQRRLAEEARLLDELRQFLSGCPTPDRVELMKFPPPSLDWVGETLKTATQAAYAAGQQHGQNLLIGLAAGRLTLNELEREQVARATRMQG